ncbi:MAG TPA: MgtC/SapB family protein [Verrucomicrobiales bacterium]|nr:MgtC/SapB family protein [Verrucomicrobiales bacterium]
MDPLLLQITVSIALGLLLGLQRQRTESSIGGIRTFPFIALMGTVSGRIAADYGGWIIGAGLLSLAAVLVFANFLKMKAGQNDPGTTTEMAALLLYLIGVLISTGAMVAAVVLGGVMLLLLHAKVSLHTFAAKVGDHDMRAIVQFALISLIILPVVPNASYGPYGVWNPFSVWLMVVLIVSISLGGYTVYKLFGARAGMLLGGVIGGLISSTATTVSFARRSAADAALAPMAAFVIMTASCVSVGRVLVEIAVAAPGKFVAIIPPVAAMLAACMVIAAVFYFSCRREKSEMPEQKNPAELKAAILFGALYAVVLVAVAAARERFGSAGLYTVAGLSGLTDMDAITLSSAQLAQAEAIDPSTAWRAILIAAMANFVFKFATVAAIGNRRLTIRMIPATGGALAVGGGILWLWPG